MTLSMCRKPANTSCRKSGGWQEGAAPVWKVEVRQWGGCGSSLTLDFP